MTLFLQPLSLSNQNKSHISALTQHNTTDNIYTKLSNPRNLKGKITHKIPTKQPKKIKPRKKFKKPRSKLKEQDQISKAEPPKKPLKKKKKRQS